MPGKAFSGRGSGNKPSRSTMRRKRRKAKTAADNKITVTPSPKIPEKPGKLVITEGRNSLFTPIKDGTTPRDLTKLSATGILRAEARRKRAAKNPKSLSTQDAVLMIKIKRLAYLQLLNPQLLMDIPSTNLQLTISLMEELSLDLKHEQSQNRLNRSLKKVPEYFDAGNYKLSALNAAIAEYIATSLGNFLIARSKTSTLENDQQLSHCSRSKFVSCCWLLKNHSKDPTCLLEERINDIVELVVQLSFYILNLTGYGTSSFTTNKLTEEIFATLDETIVSKDYLQMFKRHIKNIDKTYDASNDRATVDSSRQITARLNKILNAKQIEFAFEAEASHSLSSKPISSPS